MRSGFRGIVIGLLACVASVAVSGIACADGNMQLDVGKKQYMKYCATCHGPSGTRHRRHRVASVHEAAHQPDAARRRTTAATFPMMDVIGIVRGDQPIAAHGTREMPVWGEIIGGDPTEEGMYKKDEAEAKILTIGKYLESIQAK